MKPTSYDMTTAPEKRRPTAVPGEFERDDDAPRPVDGHDLHTVEQVTGRLITRRASLLGAAAGAWVGLLVGMLLALPTDGPVSPLLFLGSLTIGALLGAVLGSSATGRDDAGVTSPADAAQSPPHAA